MIIILMGVCGVGKTTIGQALSEILECEFIDADDFHPLVNKEKMRQGVALTDEDREPWLRVLNHELKVRLHKQQNDGGVNANIVVACSALKEAYRQKLVEDLSNDNVRWVYLKGSIDLIRRRMEERSHAYMPVGLLESQFEVLEEPKGAVIVDVNQSVKEVLARIMQEICL